MASSVLLRRHVPAAARLALAAVALASSAAADALRLRGVEYIGDLPTYLVETQARLAATDIVIDYGRSGADNLAALRAGDIDFALMAMTPLVFDALADPDRGQPDDPVILASLSHAQPLVQILSRSDGAEPNPASLHGRRVAVQPGTNAEYLWALFTEAHGLDRDRIAVAHMPVGEMPAAFAAGAIDAAVLWEPWSSQIQAARPGAIARLPVDGLYVSRWLLVGRRAAVHRERERVADILRAYAAAVREIQRRPDRAAEAIAARWPLRAVDPGALGDSLVFTLSLDWSLFRSFRQQLDWAQARSGDAAEARAPAFLDLIDPRPLRAVSPPAVRIPGGVATGAAGRP